MHHPAKGGKLGGKASAARPKASRSAGGGRPQAQRSALVIRHQLPRKGVSHKSLFRERITSTCARSDTGRRSAFGYNFRFCNV
jgi:hypothetical protein